MGQAFAAKVDGVVHVAWHIIRDHYVVDAGVIEGTAPGKKGGGSSVLRTLTEWGCIG
jgi:hypothetical protein